MSRIALDQLTSGVQVVRRRDRSVVGVVMSNPERSGGEYWVSVFFDGRPEKVLAEDLDLYHGQQDLRGCWNRAASAPTATW